MEQLDDGGFILVIYMDNMTLEERIVLKKAKIKTRVLREANDTLLTLIHYDKTTMVFEISFDPTLYKNFPERFNQFIKNNMLLIIGVESTTNRVATIRKVSLPKMLHTLWITAWTHALNAENFSKRYLHWVEDLDSRYELLELWNMAKPTGDLGE